MSEESIDLFEELTEEITHLKNTRKLAERLGYLDALTAAVKLLLAEADRRMEKAYETEDVEPSYQADVLREAADLISKLSKSND